MKAAERGWLGMLGEMQPVSRFVQCGFVLGVLLSPPAFAQQPGAPPTATFPASDPAPAATAPASPTAGEPTTTAPPAAAAPQPAAAVPPAAAAPQPAAAAPPPNPPLPPEAQADAYAAPVYEPPPPPEPPPEAKRTFPAFSVRVDPFNLLLEGQLGFELEVEVLKFMTVELVPIFVVNDSPPTFGYVSSRDEELTRESDGIGALAGSSLDVGFWLQGKAFEGYVLRAILTNYAYRYESRDSAGAIDDVEHVQRQFFGFFGSHSRWGAFTIAGGIGLGVELNNQKRCFVEDPTRDDGVRPTRDCRKDQMLIQLNRSSNGDPGGLRFAELNGGLGGVQLLGRFSLGVVF